MEHIDTVVHTLMTGIKTYVSSVTSKGFLYKKERKMNQLWYLFILYQLHFQTNNNQTRNNQIVHFITDCKL